jgi:VanZ family protein
MHQNSVISFLVKFWKSILWAIIIAIGLLTPGDKLPDRKLLQIEYLDKILHGLIFGFLQFLILFDMHLGRIIITRKRIFLSVLICLSYGAITEIIQYLLISKRKGSIADLFADITGIMLSVGFFILIKKFINRFFPRKY